MAAEIVAQSPPHSPRLADSAYPVAHGCGDITPFPGPEGPSRQVRPDEIVWKKIGPINGYAPRRLPGKVSAGGLRIQWDPKTIMPTFLGRARKRSSESVRPALFEARAWFDRTSGERKHEAVVAGDSMTTR